MRMWNVPPKCLDDKHLLSEHAEIHAFVYMIEHGRSVEGYIRNNKLEPRSLKKRHDQLVEEMKKRGIQHNTPLEQPKLDSIPEELRDVKIDVDRALADLFRVCEECKQRCA